jgi:hypothetical protein
MWREKLFLTTFQCVGLLSGMTFAKLHWQDYLSHTRLLGRPPHTWFKVIGGNLFFKIDSPLFLRVERAFQEEKSVSPDLPTSPLHPPPKVPRARKLLSTCKSGRNMPRGPPVAKFCLRNQPPLPNCTFHQISISSTPSMCLLVLT